MTELEMVSGFEKESSIRLGEPMDEAGTTAWATIAAPGKRARIN
jgi:hypothetical protein